jgi:hypothetical protein
MIKNWRTSLATLIICASLLFIGCNGHKVTTDPNQVAKSPEQAAQDQASKGDALLKGAKVFGQVLSDALAEAIPFEKTLAANGDIDPTLEPQIRQWLLDGQLATDDYNTRLAKYQHFDGDSKQIISTFLDEATAFIKRLNDQGILRIKNPRSQAIASGIILGARVATNYFKNNYGAQLK